MDTEPGSAEAGLARVVHLEGAIRGVQVSVSGLGAGPAIGLEGLSLGVVDLEPGAHVSVGLEGVRETLKGVTDDIIFLEAPEVGDAERLGNISKHFVCSFLIDYKSESEYLRTTFEIN